MSARQFRPVRMLLLTLLLLATIVVAAFWHFSTTGEEEIGGDCVDVAGTTKAESGAVPPLYLGLDTYRHLDKLPYLEFGNRVAGQSTADLAGSTIDAIRYLRVLPDGEHVLFDAIGPGIVTFMRMQENYGRP